jgi:hypothetical protein
MGNVAAQLAARPFRTRSVPVPFAAPPSGAGDMPSGGPLQVELFVGGVWVDITSYVMTRDGGGKVVINRGQPDESAQTNPGRCAFQLNNRNGQFSPRNPLGPYYGQLTRNQPLRVSVPSGTAKSYRFWGEVTAWPQDWDATGTDVWVEIEAAGILRRLGQGTQPSLSPLRAAIVGQTLVIATVVAYWPCEDSTNATIIASGFPSGSPMTISGKPSLASFSGFAGSAPIAAMTSGSAFRGSVPFYAAPIGSEVVFLVVIPAGGLTNNTVLCSVAATGDVKRWDIYYSTSSGGSIGIIGYDSHNANVFSLSAFASNINGVLGQVTLQITQSGADTSVNAGIFLLTSGATGTPTTAYDAFGTATGKQAGIFSGVAISPNGDAAGTAFGHIRVQSMAIDAFGNDDDTTVLQGAISENADYRFIRMCFSYGINYERIGAEFASVAMGVQPTASLSTVLAECVTADMGIEYELLDQIGLGYRIRQTLENQAPALALSYSAGHLAAAPKPIDDDRYTRNEITVTRPGGAQDTTELPMGTLSILNPPAGVGPYPDAKTVNIDSDSGLSDQAGWRLHLGTVDEPRYPQITLNLARAPFVSNPALRQQALAVRLGDRITVSSTPAWLPPDGISQIALGTSETIDHFQHVITYTGAPESPYRVAVADDPFYGRADTDGSQLASGALATDTTLSVSTTTSGPTWTTDLSQFPFDLVVGGERVTVLAVGTVLSSPNAFLTTGDLTGWNAQSSTISYNTVIVNMAYGASASILIVPDGVSASGGVRGNLTGVGTVTPTATYIACMWAYSPNGWSDLRPGVDWYDASGTFLSSGLGSATSVPAGVWTFIQQTLTAPASASRAVMRGRHGGTPAAANSWYAWGLRLVPSASVSSVSPQTMSVIRSVNGVVKPQTVGTDVRLFQPAIAAL